MSSLVALSSFSNSISQCDLECLDLDEDGGGRVVRSTWHGLNGSHCATCRVQNKSNKSSSGAM